MSHDGVRSWLRRGRACRAWILAAGLAPAMAIGHAPADYTTGPAPAWVEATPATPGAAPTEGGATGGVRHELVEDQVRITATSQAHYRHLVESVITSRGLDTAAHWEIEFDPTYETLVLNQVDVARDGHRVSRLNGLDAKVRQLEHDADWRIYDGRKSVLLDLPDVRPGDTVDVSYTVSGMNPVFDRHHFGSMHTQWDVPVRRTVRRLSIADGLPVRVETRHAAPAAMHSDAGGFQEWRWDVSDVKALKLDSATPVSFEPFQEIQWTDFADWGEVARWAEPLFTLPAQRSAPLQAEIERIARDNATPDARVLATLRWMQKQVRYLGIEMGQSSHAPNLPDQVFERRFGDCKDKARLMVAMLRALGIEADAVLVNAERRGAIRSDLPMPLSFDHAITVVRMVGLDYWLDPTRSPQAGTLPRLYQPDYGPALRLDGRTSKLDDTPSDNAAKHERDIDVQVDASGGAHNAVGYVVRTAYQRASADGMRDKIADGDLDTPQHDYLEFYADRFPGIRVTAPLQVEDDGTQDTITITEHYAIDHLWTRENDHRGTGFWLPAAELSGYLKAPHELKRTMPMSINGPQILRMHVDVKLPREVTGGRHDDAVRGQAFDFMKSTKATGRRLSSDYLLTVSERQIDANALPGYADKLRRARDLIGEDVWPDERAGWVPPELVQAGRDFGLVLLLMLAWLWGRTLMPKAVARPPGVVASAAGVTGVAGTAAGVAGAGVMPAVPSACDPVEAAVAPPVPTSTSPPVSETVVATPLSHRLFTDAALLLLIGVILWAGFEIWNGLSGTPFWRLVLKLPLALWAASWLARRLVPADGDRWARERPKSWAWTLVRAASLLSLGLGFCVGSKTGTVDWLVAGCCAYLALCALLERAGASGQAAGPRARDAAPT